MGESGIKEQLMLELAYHLSEEGGHGDLEEFFEKRSIKLENVGSYVSDADSKGFSHHEVYKIDDTFYFIYEWYGGKWESESCRIYLAEPRQEIRFTRTSEDFNEEYRERLYDWMDKND